MMLRTTGWQKIVILIICCVLATATGEAFAEWWGTNANPCANGHCAPVTPWGYTPTHWHQWPGAPYPEMMKPTGAKSGEEISAPPLEVQSPSKETEVQSPVPTRESTKSSDSMGLPTPAKSSDESKPNNLPSIRDLPGAQPPASDPFAPPQSSIEPNNGTLPSRASMAPRVRLGSGLPSSVSAVPDTLDLRGRRPTWSESREAPAISSIRLRAGSTEFARSIAPDQEPDLFVPSLSPRPLATASFDSPTAVRTGGNPLRSDLGTSAVRPATMIETESPTVDDYRPNTSVPTGISVRDNPLRR